MSTPTAPRKLTSPLALPLLKRRRLAQKRAALEVGAVRPHEAAAEKLCAAAGFSIEEFCAIAGVSRGHFAKVAREGRACCMAAKRWAQILDCSPDAFMDGDSNYQMGCRVAQSGGRIPGGQRKRAARAVRRHVGFAAQKSKQAGV